MYLVKRLLQIIWRTISCPIVLEQPLFHHVQRCAAPSGSIRPYFPSHGRHTNRRLAPPSGIQTPPRIAPRCLHYWMNIEYHYRFAGSSQDNLPELFLAGWTRFAPLLPSFIEQTEKWWFLYFIQMGFAHPPHRSPPFSSGGPQTDVIRCRIFSFQRTQEKKSSHMG